MLQIADIELSKVIVHKVGNSTLNESLQLSNELVAIDDNLVNNLLIKYFLTPFNENAQYHFTHLNELNLNEIYNYASATFKKRDFIKYSSLIASFLYSKSTHAQIKSGELYVVQFDNFPLGNQLNTALGIFKSETKETFLKIKKAKNNWSISAEEGININKLDKGCLIINSNKAEGYVVLTVDTTNKQEEAKFWMNDFLQIQPYTDSYHQTNNLLNICKQFINHEYKERFEVSKSDQLDLLNRSIEYFKSEEQFSFQEFSEKVIFHPEVIEAFNDYTNAFKESKQFDLSEEFPINASVVKKQEKNYKSILKLDKNFHIYIHGRRDLVEKGFDDNRKKSYYKLYFDIEH